MLQDCIFSITNVKYLLTLCIHTPYIALPAGKHWSWSYSSKSMYTHAGYFQLSCPAGSHKAVQAQPCSPHDPLLLSAVSLAPALYRETHVILSGLETIRDVALCCFLDVFSCHWILIRKLTHNTMKSILYFCDHAMFKKKNHAWYILLINCTLKNGYEKSWWLKIIYLI